MSNIVLILLILSAVINDLISRKISNKIIFFGLLSSILLKTMFFADAAYYENIFNWLGGVFIGLGVLMPLYLLGACGAGDTKLMAMVGAFVGPHTVLYAALYTLIAGGLLSIFFMLGRGVAAKTIENTRFLLTDWLMRVRTGGGAKLAPLATTAARLPYAVAIAMGTGAAVWMQHH